MPSCTSHCHQQRCSVSEEAGEGEVPPPATWEERAEAMGLLPSGERPEPRFLNSQPVAHRQTYPDTV